MFRCCRKFLKARSPAGRSKRGGGRDALGGAVKAGTPVVGGGGDCAAGAVGAGIVRSGACSVSIGTSGVVFIHADQPKTDPEGRAHTFCHAVPGKWHNMGVTLCAGGSFQWFKSALGHPENAVANLTGGDVYDVLVAEAQTAPAGCEGLCFLPYLSGERTPHADPYATGAFIGITPRTTKGHLARSVIEGVCYSLRDCIEIFREMKVPVEEVRVTGGGAKNVLWKQTLADAFDQRYLFAGCVGRRGVLASHYWRPSARKNTKASKKPAMQRFAPAMWSSRTRNGRRSIRSIIRCGRICIGRSRRIMRNWRIRVKAQSTKSEARNKFEIRT